MPKLRILVVDDSVVVRRVVSDVLSEDPRMVVVGVAANGSICLAKLEQTRVDLVILDLEMPVMDGLETISEIRKRHPKLAVIVFSALTVRGGVATLEALSRGASDYLAKPSNVSDVNEASRILREQLVPKITSICLRDADRTTVARAVPPRPLGKKSQALAIDALVIASSTGGPRALEEVAPALPEDFPVPVLIVQHMPPVFTRLLAERLDKLCAFPVQEAKDGDLLRASSAWVAPGGFHMEVQGSSSRRIKLTQNPPENSCRPAADALFRAAADSYGGRLLAVVLTGMGKDGLAGCESIRERGGQVLAQDEATSVVWGMPGGVV
ncbi:MAG: chemotaxis-specific protein-glutamate methyltransferase CheB, partial [Planctomycetales bacterium]